MSILIRNGKTLKNKAILFLINKKGQKNIEKYSDDIIVIKKDDNIVGININNYSKYFKAKNGAHSLDETQKLFFKKIASQIDLKPFLYNAKVLEVNSHPHSEKLVILKVEADKIRQIVTNQKKVKENDKIIIAIPGATLPFGQLVIENEIMNVVSEGIIVGSKVLGINNDNEMLILRGETGSQFIF